MPLRELMGAGVEIAPAGFDVADPVIDRPLVEERAHLVADARRAILRVADVGTFAVAEGSHIRFDPEADVHPFVVTQWLRGVVAALLLAQRGQFALHGSVVDVDGVAVALAGPHGVGKSTTALRLGQSGHPLVADDVSPLQCDDDDVVVVHPFERPARVFAATAAGLGLDVSQATRVLPGRRKLALPTPVRPPVRLGALAVLRPEHSAVAVEASRVHGAPALWLVGTNAYRADLLRELWETEMFAWAGKVAARVPVYEVRRPGAGWTVDAVAQTVERLARS